MSDYIGRGALKEAFENADADVCESYSDGYCDWGFGRKNINDVIDGVPAADVEPVPESERKCGRWIQINEFGEYECSYCGMRDADCTDAYHSHSVTSQQFCPNCGADMGI